MNREHDKFIIINIWFSEEPLVMMKIIVARICQKDELALKVTGLQGSPGAPPPPYPYHTLTPLTNNELSVTHFVVLTTEQEHVESGAYSLRV